MSEVEQRKKGFTIGYLAGLCGMPLVIAPAGNPDNNMSLPELPVGLEEYPYRFITKYLTESDYYLYAAKMPVSYDKSIPAFVNANDDYLHYLFYSCAADEGYDRWNHVSDFTAHPNNYPGFWTMYPSAQYIPIWSNQDIYYAENYVDTDIVFLKGSIYKGGDNAEALTNIDLLMGCRLGYIVRSQMGKGNIEIPDGVLISSDGYILTDCNGVYLIAAAAAEPDEPAVPDEPGEVATMYLYGTPSETGNIGLRVGDTVTYYAGAVLPSIESVWTPELQAEYPVVYIYALLDWYYLRIGKGYSYRYEDEKYKVYLTGYYGSYTAHDEGWGSFYDGEDGEYGIGEVKDFVSMPWTNTPILHEDGTIAKAATTPIPVGDIVEYINNIPIYEQKEDS